MDVTTSHGTVWRCQKWQFGPARALRGLDAQGGPIILKVTDAREIEILESLSDASAPVSVTLLESGTIVQPTQHAGEPYVVLRDEGNSLAETLVGRRPEAVRAAAGPIALDLLNLLAASRERGLEPLQLSADHVLLTDLTARPLLCGWSGAWRVDEAYPAGDGPHAWPEALPIAERTTVYLWGLVVSELVTGFQGKPVREGDVVHTAIPAEAWEGHPWEQTDRSRVELLRRALDPNPYKRPTLQEAHATWTLPPDPPDPGDVKVFTAPEPPTPPPSWHAQVGDVAIRSRIVRYSAMAAAGILGFFLGEAVAILTPWG
jgi:hypothetical protein